jgi:hypothetical protein
MIEEMPRQPWVIINTLWVNKMKTKDNINGLQKEEEEESSMLNLSLC